MALALALLFSSCSTTNPLTGPELVPLTGDLSGDYLLLQGTWTVTYDEFGRQAHRERLGSKFYFKGNRHWITGDKGYEWFAVDSSRTPRAIDFYDHHAPTIRGIYEIHGSELTVCTADPGKPRPTKFETSVFSGTILNKARRD